MRNPLRSILNVALVVVASWAVTLNATAADVVVDAGVRHQTIDGFGTCLISWVPRMDRYYRTPEASRMYAGELGFNILRCNLWGDGTIGPTEDAEKISHKDPAFAAEDPRTPVFVAFAKAIKQINPDARIIGTVWSPPAWMKENNSINDKLSAAIDGKTLQARQGQQGRDAQPREAPVYPHLRSGWSRCASTTRPRACRCTPCSCANEPQFTQTFEACVWTAKDLATVTGMVGDLLAKEGMKTVTFGPETLTGFNWANGPNRVRHPALADDAAAWKSLGFLATHGYSDGVNADMSRNSSAQFWQIIAERKKPYWVTEGATGKHAWPAPIVARGVGAACTTRWSRATRRRSCPGSSSRAGTPSTRSPARRAWTRRGTSRGNSRDSSPPGRCGSRRRRRTAR